MSALTAERLLSLWEHGVQRHAIDRALLLFALAAPETPLEQLADASLGRRNAALFALRRARFGERLAGWVDCPGCGERMEFEFAAAHLPPPPPLPEGGEGPIEVRGQRFSRPTSRHLALLVDAPDPESAARRLLRACAEAPELLPDDDAAIDDLLAQVEAALDAADPWADLSLAIRCPACGRADVAALDIASVLWEEFASHAVRLLDEVHTLAQAYGWREAEILALSEQRRAAYLARVNQ